jgi:hypothetical protein
MLLYDSLNEPSAGLVDEVCVPTELCLHLSHIQTHVPTKFKQRRTMQPSSNMAGSRILTSNTFNCGVWGLQFICATAGTACFLALQYQSHRFVHCTSGNIEEVTVYARAAFESTPAHLSGRTQSRDLDE